MFLISYRRFIGPVALPRLIQATNRSLSRRAYRSAGMARWRNLVRKWQESLRKLSRLRWRSSPPNLRAENEDMLKDFPTLSAIVGSLDNLLKESHPEFFGPKAHHPFTRLKGYKVIHD